MIDYVLLRFWI